MKVEFVLKISSDIYPGGDKVKQLLDFRSFIEPADQNYQISNFLRISDFLDLILTTRLVPVESGRVMQKVERVLEVLLKNNMKNYHSWVNALVAGANDECSKIAIMIEQLFVGFLRVDCKHDAAVHFN